MQKIICSSILIVLVALIVTNCSNSDKFDPKGYQSLKWGMSSVEVKAIYPQAIRNKYDDNELILGRKDGDISEITFEFRDDHLIQVKQKMKSGIGNHKKYLNNLVSKYNKFHHHSTIDRTARANGRSLDYEQNLYTWDFPTTDIALITSAGIASIHFRVHQE